MFPSHSLDLMTDRLTTSTFFGKVIVGAIVEKPRGVGRDRPRISRLKDEVFIDLSITALWIFIPKRSKHVDFKKEIDVTHNKMWRLVVNAYYG